MASTDLLERQSPDPAREVIDLPQMAHAMHARDPQQFTSKIVDWALTLSSSA